MPYLRFFFVLMFYSTLSHSQTNYTTTGDGDFDDCTIWTLTCPPDPLPFGDSIFISHVISLTGNIDISGVMTINFGGEINGNKAIKIDPSGTIINNGIIDIQKQLHNDGSWYNNGYVNAQEVHNDGYICNTDTIEIESDEEFDNHGGTIECGGLIIACEFKTHDNGGSLSGLSDTDICCIDGSDPIIDYQDGIIDSNTVSLCGVNLLGVPLPIELLKFDVVSDDQVVKNKWRTASELNNDYFLISSSTNGVTFREIGKINGAGNSSSLLKYEFIDTEPRSGISFYKLTQVDFDGKATVVGVRSVYISPINEIILYPNPVKNDLNIKFNSESNLNINIQVYNVMGEVIYSNHEQVMIGTNNYLVDVKGLPVGIYFINMVSSKNTKLNYKFIKY